MEDKSQNLIMGIIVASGPIKWEACQLRGAHLVKHNITRTRAVSLENHLDC